MVSMKRRRLLQAGTAAVAAPYVLRHRFAVAQDKPAEMIVRAWGGVWVDSLNKGVSEPFSEMTGIAIRHDLTEDNEIRPKIWAAVDQGRMPPIHINWDTSTNATKSALRGVTEDLGDLENLEPLLPLARPVGFDGWPLVNTYAYAYVLAYREEAFPDGPPTSWDVMIDPKFKGRVAIYDDGIGFHPAAQIAGGGSFADIPDDMEPAWEFFRQLKANEPLLGEDPDFTNWFQNGEIDVACTIISNARAARQNGVPVAWTIPEEGAKLDTDGLWIPQGLPENERYWAKRYIDFALTLDAQQTWCNALGLPAVHPDVTPPEDLVGDPSYPTSEADLQRFIRVPTPVLVQHESDWFAKVNEIMQG